MNEAKPFRRTKLSGIKHSVHSWRKRHVGGFGLVPPGHRRGSHQSSPNRCSGPEPGVTASQPRVLAGSGGYSAQWRQSSVTSLLQHKLGNRVLHERSNRPTRATPADKCKAWATSGSFSTPVLRLFQYLMERRQSEGIQHFSQASSQFPVGLVSCKLFTQRREDEDELASPWTLPGAGGVSTPLAQWKRTGLPCLERQPSRRLCPRM